MRPVAYQMARTAMHPHTTIPVTVKNIIDYPLLLYFSYIRCNETTSAREDRDERTSSCVQCLYRIHLEVHGFYHSAPYHTLASVLVLCCAALSLERFSFSKLRQVFYSP